MIAEITSFFGRFHPVLVHLPIGILLLAFVFHLLAFSERFRKLKSAVRPSLFLGTISAMAAAGSGYYLSIEGGYDEALLTQHKWMGFATAGLTVIMYLFTRKYSFLTKDDRRKAITILFFPLVILLTWTGHLGGSMTHGDDFLFHAAPSKDSDKMETKRIPISNLEEAEVFNDIVRPLLEEKCFACHSSKKQKGQLRLDVVDLIKKGGKHGEIIVAGDPKESEMFQRITLSEEEKKHMPPKKEPQVTSTEIELIKWWISEGATFDKKVKEFAQRDELLAYLNTVNYNTHESWIPERETSEPDQSAIKELQSVGVAVVPVAISSNYLSVNFAGKKVIVQRDIEVLNALSQQVIDLNLSRTSVTDQNLIEISLLKELRVLNLSHTAVTNRGVSELKKLENLTRLNLVETQVDSETLKSLNEMKALTELYVFNTNITKEDLAGWNPQVKVDTGNYQLPILTSDTITFRRK